MVINRFVTDMDNHINLVLLIMFELCLMFITLRRFNRCLFSPSVLTISLFLISSLLCFYCRFYWDIVFYFETFIVVSLGLLFIFVAEIFAKKNQINHIENGNIYLIELPNSIKIIISIYSVVATILYFYEIWKIGIAQNMLIGEAIANVKEDFSSYEDSFNPIIRQGYKMVIAIAYIFTYFFVNNYVICKQKLRVSFWYILPLFSGICINLISGSRGDMLRLVLLFLFFYYMWLWQKNYWQKRPNINLVKIAIPVLTIMLSIFFLARLFVKVDIESQERVGGPIEYLSYYIGSPLQVLNIHINQITNHPNANEATSFAYCTMNGIYDFLIKNNFIDKTSINRPKVGFGFEYIGGESNAAGNVDTILSQSIIDFGIIGMCVYVFVIYYLISRYFYRNVLYKSMSDKSVKQIILFSFFYYIVEMSFYADCTGQVLSQTGVLQFICLLFLVRFLIKPQYFTPYE